MKSIATHNFHLPLPKNVYQELLCEAKKQKIPATQVARRALESWLKEQRQLAVKEELALYVNSVAGTDEDLDSSFEDAATEHWLTEDESREAR